MSSSPTPMNYNWTVNYTKQMDSTFFVENELQFCLLYFDQEPNISEDFRRKQIGQIIK